MQIRFQLANLKKKEVLVTDYFHKMKALGDTTLSAIGHPLHEEVIISYIPSGLGHDYESLVMSISTRAESVGLNELYAHLVSHEL